MEIENIGKRWKIGSEERGNKMALKLRQTSKYRRGVVI
jgi:hypothetical protein